YSLKILKSLHTPLNTFPNIDQKTDSLSIVDFPPDSLKEISEEDQQLLHAFVQTTVPTSQAYEHAWGYLIQSTRNGKLRWYDQTFPQLLIDLKVLIENKGSDYRKLRKYLHRGGCKYQIRSYQAQDQEAVLNLLALKDSITSSQRYSASHDMYPSSATEKYVIE